MKAWVNIYRGHLTILKDGSAGTLLYPTKKMADENASPRRVACVPVTFEEGDGLRGAKNVGTRSSFAQRDKVAHA